MAKQINIRDLKYIESEKKNYIKNQAIIDGLVKILEKGAKQRSSGDIEKLVGIVAKLPFVKSSKLL